jgi:large subunit ribosomal protein L24e
MHISRMALSRDKHRAHRKKVLEAAKSSVKLVTPMSDGPETPKIREKVKVPSKSRSALVQGEGRSMGMDLD